MNMKYRTLTCTALLAAFTASLGGQSGSSSEARPEAGVQMVGVEGEGARYWSRWRGPSGQGLAAGTGYPDTWSATQNVVWKKRVPGRGNSSPIVWGDRILLTTEYDGGRRLSLLAYRRSDGSPLWETCTGGTIAIVPLQEWSCVCNPGHRW